MKVSSDSPVAGFLGPLLLVLRLGIRGIRGACIRLPSETVHLICLLQVFCFLSFYVLDVFLFFSSSFYLDRRLRLLWLRSARSRSLCGVPFSVSPSVSSTMTIAWVVSSSSSLIIRHHLHHVPAS